ncbi:MULTISPECIES: hypothetical protein [unclassified Sinorhizobium]|uniref:hypothetical protein n=1 Tax=unclassified Sinorhizobium TaxID=2613772 RepID=UPI0024C316D6|nr:MULTISPECIES: hypothetical protein [unclassified Sinorhizobium]MDK1378202.1 hypothetical protein [Sinorhizobium sp. 6-70]MDK1482728.1 hypothetical protein [Sinorhizobium sp. 6-117]
MLDTIDQASGGRDYDLSDRTAQHQLPLMATLATVHQPSALEGEITLPRTDLFDRARDSSIGISTRADVPRFADFAIQEKLSGTLAKAKDFATTVDISAVASLVLRLNREYREAAREDRWAARDAEMAGQKAAAKALRDSGVCQLLGAIAISCGAMAGAGVNLKGVRQIEKQFNAHDRALKAPIADNSATRLSEGNLEGRAQTPDRSGLFDKSATSTQPGNHDAPPSGDTAEAFNFTSIIQAQTAAQTEGMRWSAMGTIATEASKLPGAGLNMGATHFQEEKVRLEADSTKAHEQAEDESEFIANYEKLIQDILEKLAEIRRTDTEMRSKIINMG